jgi:dihydroneopterin aldolase
MEGPRYAVTVCGLVLMSSIGIRAKERQRKQRVRVSVDLIAADPFPGDDRWRIINYEKIVAGIREVAGAGHIDLCEGLAERVCTVCFADPRVAQVRVWVEKLDVFPDAEGSAPSSSECGRLAPHPDERGSTRRDGPPHGERLAGLGDIVDPQNLNALLNRG